MIPVNRYPVVLYLDEKYVFDVLAQMESGFSKLETIRTKASEQGDATNTVSGKAGVPSILSFFNLQLSGERTAKTGTATQIEKSVEKVHTANSLFARLRDTLYEQGYIVVDDFDKAQTGLFTEFKVTLQRNPVTGVFTAVLQLMKLFNATAQVPVRPTPPKSQNQRQNTSSKEPQTQVESLLKELASGNTSDFIGTSVANKDVRIVMTIDLTVTSEAVLTDMENGQYVVFGKIIRKIANNDESISLLRKTNFRYMESSMISGLFDSLNAGAIQGLQLPEIVTEIEGPSLQIIPIAIFS